MPGSLYLSSLSQTLGISVNESPALNDLELEGLRQERNSVKQMEMAAGDGRLASVAPLTPFF